MITLPCLQSISLHTSICGWAFICCEARYWSAHVYPKVRLRMYICTLVNGVAEMSVALWRATQMWKMLTGEAIYSNRLQHSIFQPHAAMWQNSLVALPFPPLTICQHAPGVLSLHVDLCKWVLVAPDEYVSFHSSRVRRVFRLRELSDPVAGFCSIW